jgi:hypothetical protein
MSIIDDCVQFLEDLILGDFNETQQVSAQVIGGLISLIPIVDQVMDVRDVSGNLYRINKQGGIAKATLEQKIDFGFAAFGVIPELGSVFKTVFKPLYKQRKAAQGLVNGGVAMIERMLGKNKGGAVAWVKALDWAGNVQIAIDQANMALDSCIGLLDYIGRGHWWCPDDLSQQARDIAPGLKALRGKLAAPIREAATHIRAFLEEMLGEHAAAVALAVAGNAAGVRRTALPASKTVHMKVAGEPRVNGKKTVGKMVRTAEHVAYESYQALNFAAKGLMGEHIVDHYVIEQKGWGLEWNRHDMAGAHSGKPAGWLGNPRKLNENQTPLYLCTPSAQVLTSGIDSLWLTNRMAPHEFAVVEAKANMNPNAKLLSLLGEANDQSNSRPKAQRRKSPQSGVSKIQTTTVTATPSKVLQMSHKWIEARVMKDFRRYARKIMPGTNRVNYSRHVFLVTPAQSAEHIEAFTKIIEEGFVSNPSAAQKYAGIHAVHNIQREFGESDLDVAEKEYKLLDKRLKSGKRK